MANQCEDNSTKYDMLAIITDLVKQRSVKEISKELDVAPGTIKRWMELKNVPPSYMFDLLKLSNIEIDYSSFSHKDKDQFFTPTETAQYCFEKFKTLVSNYDNEETYTYIEPSAGDGSFLKVFPEDRRIGLDIEPRNEEIIQQDYLSWKPEEGKYIVFGNPPFGLRGNLALRFINHSASFADYVCFILPQLFESDGKGVPRKRVKGYHLLHSEKINSDFYEPSSKNVKVQCIFQIWSKNHSNSQYEIKEKDESIIKIYSLSDGGTPSTTRNKKMFHKCDVYIPSTCFGKDNMRYYETFDELPRRKGYGVVFNKDREENIYKFKSIDWSSVAFLSTNSAYNIRTSQIQSQFS